MGWNIRRISSDSPRVNRSGKSKRTEKSVPILDERLSYRPFPDEEWSYEEGEICYNGDGINDMIEENYEEAGNLIAISSGLTKYKNFVWNNGGKDRSNFNGRADALLGKVTSRISGIYEEKTCGIKCNFINGELWINGINVATLIDLYQVRPEPKVRAYLMSWRQKLILLLQNPKAKHSADGRIEAAKKLFAKMEAALKCTPDTRRLLTAPSRH